MKKNACFIAVLFFACVMGYAQNTTTLDPPGKALAPTPEELVEIYGLIPKTETGYIAPRYKLYKTENIYTLLKLNTATGAVWQIHYETNTTTGAQYPIAENAAAWVDGEGRPGRFELYPTNNMYTFILLDTEKGTTYQVQWSTDANKRFRIRIK